MNVSKLGSILKVFSGTEPTAEERRALYREVMLMTLARATSADANINPCEVETVQRVLQEVTGESLSAADIRVAAASALYEAAPLADYLTRASGKLEPQERGTIVAALARVIKSDRRVSPNEVDFLNGVARALEVTPAEMLGLYG